MNPNRSSVSCAIRTGVVFALITRGAFAASGCADSGAPDPLPSTSASPAAPSEAETTAAVWALIDPKLTNGDLAPIETFTVDRIVRDAEGRWVASAYLTPPATASYWPSKIVVVRRPTGWETQSLTVDKTFGGTQMVQ